MNWYAKFNQYCKFSFKEDFNIPYVVIIWNLAVCTFIAFSDMNEVGTYGSKEVLSGTENSFRPNTQGETVHHINFELYAQ